ncbi:MAG: transketolase [bacterium]
MHKLPAGTHPASSDNWQKEARRVAFGIRQRVLEYTLKNNGGYLSQACSSAEIFAVLYTKVMNLGSVEEPLVPGKFCGVPNANNPDYRRGDYFNGPKGPHFDRFFLSPTHYSLVLYATLVETGRMAEEGLSEFNKDGGIVEMIGAEHSPGMEIMTGSLGQGISQATGIALARKLHKESGRVWVLMSDGELQAGQVWEALQTICFYTLDNVGIYIDVNGYQCDGKTSKVMNTGNLVERFESFGCRVCRVDGHDIGALAGPADLPTDGRPLIVICETSPFQGIEPLKQRAPKFHYIRFPDDTERKKFEKVLIAMKKG